MYGKKVLSGNKKALYSMLKNMTIDIVTRHYYKDVKKPEKLW